MAVETKQAFETNKTGIGDKIRHFKVLGDQVLQNYMLIQYQEEHLLFYL